MAVENHSRKIFKNASVTYYTASLFFPIEVQKEVTALYAFVRTVDDFVDAQPQDGAGYYAFVDEYRKALIARQKNTNACISEFISLQQKYHFKQTWVDAFLKAMELDLYKKTYKTIAELERYMYGSAEVIGCMLCAIFGVEERLYPAARMLGKSMQYANFIRDIAEDCQLGRQYLPSEITTAFGVYSLLQPVTQREKNNFKRLLQHEARRYSQWSATSKIGVQALQRRYRIPVATAASMYDWTVQTIMNQPEIVWKKKIKPHPYRVLVQAMKNSLN